MSTEPVEVGHDDATDGQKIDGIVEQMRADISQGNAESLREVLGQRFHDAGLELTDAEFTRIVAEIRA